MSILPSIYLAPGFCINGERIPLSVAVENGSGRSITMRAEISKQVTYSVKGNHRFNQSIIAQASSGAIPSSLLRHLEPRKFHHASRRNESIYLTDDIH